jgi:phage N-6-adenine-methyltransferase
MNTEVMFSSAIVIWSTPQRFFDQYNQKYQFTLDVCALPENAKCPVYFTPDDDGLKQTWEGVVWMNPPYGKKIPKWIEKASQEANCNKTKWFHFYQHGLIRDGSTTTSTTSAGWKSNSLKEG